MASSPRVTVVTPVFNLVRYLPETVASLEAQTFRDWEHVIVDDGSTSPEASELLAEYARAGRQVLHTEDRGLGAARNTGFSAGSGEFLLALDSDDRLDTTFLERTVAALDATPAAGMAVTGTSLFGALRGKAMVPPCDLVTLLCTNVVPAAGLTRRTCWEQIGGYPDRTDADIDGMDDWSFILSILEHGWTWTVVPEYLFHHRVRGDSFAARNRQPERRREMLRELIRLHEQTYRDHHVDVFLHLDAKIRRLESTGPAARLRRALRRF